MSDVLQSSFALEGKVVNVGKEENPTETMTKKCLWLELFADTGYPQVVEVEFLNDKTSIIGKYRAGDKVVVDVNLRGRVSQLRDGTERCFYSFSAWRIKGHASGGSTEDTAGSTQAPRPAASTTSEAEPEDLPF